MRFLTAKLLAISTSIALSSTIQAEPYIGVHTGYPYWAGIQLGYNFLDSGFGVKLIAETASFELNRITVAGYYKINTDSAGSGFYFGIGGGLSSDLSERYIVCVTKIAEPCQKFKPIAELNVSIGYNWRLTQSFGLSVEITEPMWFTSRNSSNGFHLSELPIGTISFNYHF